MQNKPRLGAWVRHSRLSLLSSFALACALAVLFTLSACGGGGSAPPVTQTTTTVPFEIVAALKATPGVLSVEEKTTTVANARFFVLSFQQPVDHQNPLGASFPQTASLLLRDRNAPLVLAATGYGISRTSPSEQEPTRLLNANQLTMEHRFFQSSTPNPLDWNLLNIWQAANDQHRLVQAFKPIFTGKWINTGASKGGMTSIFHRRFFPNDVSATVAYVAPIMFAADDARFVPFIKSRGDAANRAAIEAWQQAMLDHREEMKVLFKQDADRLGETLNSLGLDKAFEFAVLEAPFTLWQYGNASLAAKVPAANASVAQLYEYLDATSFGVVKTWSDSTMNYYQAFYQQTATQLGYGAVPEAHLKGLRYPGQDTGAAYPPFGASKVYDPAAMRDIQNWVEQNASSIMFIYGENDPWTAAAFELSASAMARDNWRYTVALGNHGSKLGQLPSTERAAAYAKLSNWAGVPVISSQAPAEPKLTGRFDQERFSH